MLLNIHSYYSLRYGTYSIDQLIEQMLAHGYDTGVLTDINNSSATLQYMRKSNAARINGSAGMECRHERELPYVGIAKHEEGFKGLNDLMTHANQSQEPLPKRAPEFKNVFVVYPFGSLKPKELKDYEYIGIRKCEVNKVVLAPKQDLDRFVILQTISYQPENFMLHKQLRAIDHNILISQLEERHIGREDETFISKSQLIATYGSVPTLIKNTERLLGECGFDVEFSGSKNVKHFTGSRYGDKELLYRYAMQGLEKRYGQNNPVARERVLKELEIIDQLNFSSYFLITDDICRYARSQDFYYVGRGSGANSVVAYCLEITDVCPIELNLYFERFLNPKRKSPPDFDVDFSWQERDKIYE